MKLQRDFTDTQCLPHPRYLPYRNDDRGESRTTWGAGGGGSIDPRRTNKVGSRRLNVPSKNIPQDATEGERKGAKPRQFSRDSIFLLPTFTPVRSSNEQGTANRHVSPLSVPPGATVKSRGAPRLNGPDHSIMSNSLSISQPFVRSLRWRVPLVSLLRPSSWARRMFVSLPFVSFRFVSGVWGGGVAWISADQRVGIPRWRQIFDRALPPSYDKMNETKLRFRQGRTLAVTNLCLWQIFFRLARFGVDA